MSGEISEYFSKRLGARIIHSSPYYPQGNGINESSHRLLTHMIKTQISDNYYFDLPALTKIATMVHNATPHPAIGTTPFEAVFGHEMVLPHLQPYTTAITEAARREQQLDFAWRKLFSFQLKSLTEQQAKSVSPQPLIKVDDIVSFPLSPAEKDEFRHLSGCSKWNPKYSFPYRVVKVNKGQAELNPLWTMSRPRVAPLSSLHRLLPETPRELKDLVPKVLRIPASPQVAVEPDVAPFTNVPITEVPDQTVADFPKKRQVAAIKSAAKSPRKRPGPKTGGGAEV